MKKLYFSFAALTALALASCSQSEDFGSTVEEQVPVQFSTYTARATRAGQTGEMTTATLKTSGFGVFAYYTGADKYGKETGKSTNAGNFKPNFMYNQKVEADGDNWKYSPLKYWPNDNETADDQNAVGVNNTGKVSFFAYAPYATPGASEDFGITALSGKSDTSDPLVSYKLNSTKSVDLLWGTTSTNGAKTYETEGQVGVQADAATAYKVNENLTKMKTQGKIGFNFIHALAKLGGSSTATGEGAKPNGLLIQLDIDDPATAAITGGNLDNATKVTVKSIKITNDLDASGSIDKDDEKTIASTGKLNLATGKWDTSDATKDALINYVVDNKGADGVPLLADAIKDVNDDDSKFVAVATTVTGVTITPQNVYKDATAPLLLIPGTAPTFLVEIEYYVNTTDAQLENGGSRIKNVIKKQVTFPTIEMNKMYNVVLHLGLTGVKVTATVENWSAPVDDPATTGVDESQVGTQVDLPINVK